jgi:4-amino-4-deoxy-L-arabinose transferase-like glycosyltransferase
MENSKLEMLGNRHHSTPTGNGLLTPLAVPGEAAAGTLAPQGERWTYAFLALGVLGRAVRYFLRFPLWGDECYVSVNFFHRGYLDLLRPLDYHQVGPYLWLWTQKTAVNLFGFSELSLRLPAFLSSILSLFLFYHLARRLLAGPARVIAVAFFAVGYPCLRYAAEAKIYPLDLFTGLLLVVLLVEWLYHPDQRKWPIALTVWAPVAMGLSYAAAFSAGAISVLLLGMILRRRLPGGWKMWLVYNAGVVLGAALTFLLTARGQMTADQSFQSEAYGLLGAFPPLDSVGAFAKWMVLTHTGAFFAHPLGGDNGGSTLTLLLCLIGAGVFLRRREVLPPLLLALPLTLHLLAAVMHRYPYGTHVKFSLYVAPMIYVLFAVGIAALLGLDLRQGKTACFLRNLRIVLILAAVIGMASIARDLYRPYKTRADQQVRAFAQWFWPLAGFEDRAVDLKDDLGYEFSRGTWHNLSASSMYLTNKYIYGSRPMPALPRPANVPPPSQKVLRCVLYKDSREDFDQAAFERWLTGMKQTHPYLGRDVYPFARMDKRERRIVTLDYIEVYKFDLSAESQGPATGSGSTSTQ